jgi:hypothetical protein
MKKIIAVAILLLSIPTYSQIKTDYIGENEYGFLCLTEVAKNDYMWANAFINPPIKMSKLEMRLYIKNTPVKTEKQANEIINDIDLAREYILEKNDEKKKLIILDCENIRDSVIEKYSKELLNAKQKHSDAIDYVGKNRERLEEERLHKIDSLEKAYIGRLDGEIFQRKKKEIDDKYYYETTGRINSAKNKVVSILSERHEELRNTLMKKYGFNYFLDIYDFIDGETKELEKHIDSQISGRYYSF